MTAFLTAHPEITVVLIFLAAVGAHVGVGALLHGLRLKDFDWHKFGAFVEDDLASTRAKVIAISFVASVATTVFTGGDLKQAFYPAFITLSAACAAATLPILRDTLYELMQLVSGAQVAPSPGPALRGA